MQAGDVCILSFERCTPANNALSYNYINDKRALCVFAIHIFSQRCLSNTLARSHHQSHLHWTHTQRTNHYDLMICKMWMQVSFSLSLSPSFIIKTENGKHTRTNYDTIHGLYFNRLHKTNTYTSATTQWESQKIKERRRERERGRDCSKSSSGIVRLHPTPKFDVITSITKLYSKHF